MNRYGIIFGVVLAVVGCDTKSGDDDNSKNPESLCDATCATVKAATKGCVEITDAFCAYFYRCYSGTELHDLESEMGWSGQAACKQSMASEACSDDELGAPVREGRQVVSQDDVDQCTAELASFECLALEDFVNHPELNVACAAPEGTVPTGDPCVVSEDCAGLEGYCSGASVCENRSGADYEIVCDIPLAAGVCPGDTCLKFVDNVQGISGTCTRRCEEDEECGFGAVCEDVGDSTKVCLGTCLADEDCDAGLACGIAPNKVVGVCIVQPL